MISFKIDSMSQFLYVIHPRLYVVLYYRILTVCYINIRNCRRFGVAHGFIFLFFWGNFSLFVFSLSLSLSLSVSVSLFLPLSFSLSLSLSEDISVGQLGPLNFDCSESSFFKVCYIGMNSSGTRN